MQFIKKSYFLLQARENPYQYYKSRKIPYQVLQVTRAASERAMDKIIITILPSCTGKITHLLPLTLLLVLRTRNNTDSNKLVIFFGIALYSGDNYILSVSSLTD